MLTDDQRAHVALALAKQVTARWARRGIAVTPTAGWQLARWICCGKATK